MVLVYITCKDKKEAANISKQLLKKKLIACSNMLPAQSMYWWKNKIVNEKEIVMLAKTKNKNYGRIVKEVKKIHSYDVPCILKLDTDSNKEYGNWVNRTVR